MKGWDFPCGWRETKQKSYEEIQTTYFRVKSTEKRPLAFEKEKISNTSSNPLSKMTLWRFWTWMGKLLWSNALTVKFQKHLTAFSSTLQVGFFPPRLNAICSIWWISCQCARVDCEEIHRKWISWARWEGGGRGLLRNHSVRALITIPG